MQPTEPTPDHGFRRAMLCGVVGYLACVLAWAAAAGGLPPPEAKGRLLFDCLAPAFVTGLIVRGRRWPWAGIVVVYAAAAVCLLVVATLPRLTAGR
jgi:hypothetical protein